MLKALRSIALVISVFLISACFHRVPNGMVAVPAGEFVMGTDAVDEENLAAMHGIVKPWFVDEGPARTVYLPLYYIDQHEVTNTDYAKFIIGTQHSPPPYWEHGVYARGTENYPVVMVKWREAQQYCAFKGGRLPSEAEWEKAAKGRDNSPYPWGKNFDVKKANIGGSVGDLSPAGHFPQGQSAVGAVDMIGNVWEWTSDWYEPYPGSSYQSERFGKKLKVIRGNSWSSIGHYPPEVQNELLKHHSTSTFRLFAPEDASVADVGFRCVQPN